ncbi:type II toxin-antitoxin system HicB family antitoxin [Bacillota bacterium]
MKNAYPVILIPAEEGGYLVFIPDFDVHTQGEDMAEAISMARDAIAMMGCYMEDENEEIPEPSSIDSISAGEGEIKTLVDVDFELYRKKNDNRAVRKNVTIPSWLNAEAEKAGVNFSATLQSALKEQLGL